MKKEGMILNNVAPRSAIRFMVSVAMAAAAGFAFGQGALSWGDAGSLGVRESASTDFEHPGRFAFDGDPLSYWRLEDGETAGWIERRFSGKIRVASAIADVDLPENSSIELFRLEGEHWIGVPGAIATGPMSGTAEFHVAMDEKPTERMLLKLSGANAGGARVRRLAFEEIASPEAYGKILPASYSANFTRYINIAPERLWDGRIDNAWYEPFARVPPELRRAHQEGRLGDVFPPEARNPRKPGEITWELGAERRIDVVKAYFLEPRRTITVEFWDGSTWTGATEITGWKGWVRKDLPDPVVTSRIRMSFPRNWDKARYIGEVEFWGTGFNPGDGLSLPVPDPSADGKYWFTLDAFEGRSLDAELVVKAERNSPLAVTIDGERREALPAAWIKGRTIYRFRIDADERETGDSFISVAGGDVLESCVFSPARDDGRIDLGWPWNDGYASADAPRPGVPPAGITEREWDLGVEYSLERLRVRAALGESLRFYTGRGWNRRPVAWTLSGDGWKEADLGGLETQVLSCDSPVPVVLDEIELFGTVSRARGHRAELWWPRSGRGAAASGGGGFVVGWTDDESDEVAISGRAPRREGRVFWLADEDADYGGLPSFSIGVSNGGERHESRHRRWESRGDAGSIDQGDDFAATESDAMTLSGTVMRPGTRVFAQGVELPLSGRTFAVDAPLAPGYQTLTFEFWDKQKKNLLQAIEKPVWRKPGEAALVFDLPPGDLWTQSTEIRISGRLGNGVGLVLERDGAAVSVLDQGFAETISLENGDRSIAYILTDAFGSRKECVLHIHRDDVKPDISILSPLEGQYLNSQAVDIAATSPTDAALWWKVNDGEWAPGIAREFTRTDYLEDGKYEYRIVAQDRAGNMSDEAAVSFWVDIVEPLSFPVFMDASGWSSDNRPTLSFSTVDSTTGVDHYEYSDGGAGWSDAASPFEVPVLSDGQHTLYVAAVDKAGNRRTESVQAFIDTSVPPPPASFRLVPGADRVEVKWTGVDDGEGFQSYWIERQPSWAEGIRIIAGGAYGVQSCVDQAVTTGEDYSYRVWAVDRAGNESPKTGWLNAIAGIASVPKAAEGPTLVEFNQVTLSVPEGAAAADVTRFQIQEAVLEDPEEAPARALLSKIFEFTVVRTGPDGETVSPHAVFSSDVAIEMAYDAAKLPEGYGDLDLRPFYYDTLWGEWIPIERYFVDPAAGKVIFRTNHFTPYALLAERAGSVSPQLIRGAASGGFGSAIRHDSAGINPETGSAYTSFTELVLPGKAGFDLALRRVYDTAFAQKDSETSPPAEIDGDAPWKIGRGWRLQMPSLTRSAGGLWAKGPDGASFSFGEGTVIAESSWSGAYAWVIMQSHERVDVEIVLMFKKKFLTADSYGFFGAELRIKDGRTVAYDEKGRVTSMVDSTGLHSIAFVYENDRTIITDSMGRVITVARNASWIYGIIAASSGAADAKKSMILYQINSDACLVKAFDAGFRQWTYGYGQIMLKTSSSLNNAPAGTVNPPPSYTFVRALRSISGLGLGTQEIEYEAKQLNYDDEEEGTGTEKRTWSISTQRIMAKRIKVFGAIGADTEAVTPLRTYVTDVTLEHAGDGQFVVKDSTVTDGLVKAETTYQKIEEERRALSEASESMKDNADWGAGMREDDTEWIAYPVLTTRRTADSSNAFIDHEALTWNAEKTKISNKIVSKIEGVYNLNSTNRVYETYYYDGWGNTTQYRREAHVGARWDIVSMDFNYYDKARTDYYYNQALPDNVELVFPAGLARSNHCMLASKGVASHWQDESVDYEHSNKYSVLEFEGYAYNTLGQMTERYTRGSAADGSFVWSNTSYTYNAEGEIETVTQPPRSSGDARQTTRYAHDYTPLEEYRVTTTYEDVKLDGQDPAATAQDIVIRTAFEKLRGLPLMGVDPRGSAWKRAYDGLGRMTELWAPPETSTKFIAFPEYSQLYLAGSAFVHTAIQYHDALTGPTVTVTAPSGLVTTYSFDPRGRHTQTASVNTGLNDSLTATAQEIITEVKEYDTFDLLIRKKGPYSDIESSIYSPARGIDDLVTVFGYDDRGRLKTIKRPGENNTATFDYTDTTNTVMMTDEKGVKTRSVRDWGGRTISEGVKKDDTWIESKIYYDGSGRVMAMKDPLGRWTNLKYDDRGLPVTITLPSRDVAQRDSEGALSAGLQAASPVVTRTYYDDGSLKTVERTTGEDGTLSSVAYVYNGLGMVLSQTAKAAAAKTITRTYKYDVSGNTLASELSGSDNTAWKNKTTFGYNDWGKLDWRDDYVSSDTAYRTSLEYDVYGNLSSVTDPRGNAMDEINDDVKKYNIDFTMEMAYDMLGRVTSMTQPDQPDKTAGGTAAFLYDGAGNLLEKRNPDGSLEHYRYTPRGLLDTASVNNPGGEGTDDDIAALLTDYAYDSAGRITSVSYPSGITVSRAYDGLGRVVSEGNTALGITAYQYDDMGNILRVTDGNGKATQYAYNPEGLVTKTTDALGKEWTTDYSLMNQPARITDPNGNVRTFSYDRLGRLTGETTPWGGSSSYGYDAAGNPVSQTDPRGTSFTRTFSWLNALTGETATNAGIAVAPETLTLTYDEAGQLMSAANDAVTTQYNLAEDAYVPNPYGLITRVTQSIERTVGTTTTTKTLISAFDYDQYQRLKKVTTPDGLSVDYAYDGLGRLSSYERETVAATDTSIAQGISGSLSYGSLTGLLDQVILGNGVTQERSYENGRLSGISYGKTVGTDVLKSYEYEYDLAGNIRYKTVDGALNRNEYIYDARNMLLSAHEFGAFQKQAETPRYGKATRDKTGAKPLTFTVTAEETIQLDMANQSLGVDLGQSYPVSRVELLPQSKNVRLNKSKQIRLYTAQYNDADAGYAADWTQVPETDYRFDTDPETGAIVIQFKPFKNARFLKVNTTWDDRNDDNESIGAPDGYTNIVKQVLRVWVVTDENTETYTYDDAGNRTKVNDATYLYRQNALGKNMSLLENDGTWYYFYDQNGNTTAKAKARTGTAPTYTPDLTQEYWTYAYDLHNRLKAVYHRAVKVADYSYDATGMMVLREAGDEKATYYQYSPSGELIYKEKPEEAFTRSIVYNQDGIAGWTDSKKEGETTTRVNRYALTDHLGSVTMVTDEAGTTLWESEYKPFGEVASAEGSLDMEGIFTGKEYDSETGLYYFNARWYDPATARFLTEDPIKDGATWYAYCGNNPVNFTDPSGLMGIAPPPLTGPLDMPEIPDDEPPPIPTPPPPPIETVPGDTLKPLDITDPAPEPSPPAAPGGSDEEPGETTQGESQYGMDLQGTMSISGGMGDSPNQSQEKKQQWWEKDLLAQFDEVVKYGQDYNKEEASWRIKNWDILGAGINKYAQFFWWCVDNVVADDMAQLEYEAGLAASTWGISVALSLTPLDDISIFLSNKIGNSKLGSGIRASKIGQLVDDIGEWLGDKIRIISNDSGDKVFLSADGTKRVRFDLNNPAPHYSPHGHIEELVNGKWVKSKPIYPTDVPHK